MVLAETANEDGLYDGSEIDFDLSDMEDDPFDSVSDIDETRHFMGPARRRRRLRKLQGKYLWSSRIQWHVKEYFTFISCFISNRHGQ